MTPRENHILSGLSASEYTGLVAKTELVLMPQGKVLSEAEQPLRHVYFPATSVVSTLNVTGDGASTQVAMIGREGVVGATTLMSNTISNNAFVVQIGGYGYRINIDEAMAEFSRFGPLHDLLLRFVQALSTQVFQNAVCYRHHSTEHQICRWLLMCIDRIGGNELEVPQSLIATMIGVRRESVTHATGILQERGAISKQRGKIIILDRSKLEACACECYRVITREYDRLLARPSASAGEEAMAPE